MAEDLVFARKASGLVRGLDMWDAFGAGLMTCQPIATLWLMVGIASRSTRPATFSSRSPSARSPPASAPRSSGASSAALCRAPAASTSTTRASCTRRSRWAPSSATSSPSSTGTGTSPPGSACRRSSSSASTWAGQGFADWVASSAGLVILGLIAVVVGYLSVAFSMKSYALIQKIMLIPAIGGVHRADRRPLPLEQGRRSFTTGTRSPSSTSRSATRTSSRPRGRSPTTGAGAARSAASAASTRCSSTTTPSRTLAARSSGPTRHS